MIYEALGHAIPEFAHLPMILGADKKKLSKRHGATFVTEYEDMGFTSEAMLNYLARLGWSYKDQEIFTVDELIKHFELEQVGKSSSVFDMEKFTWVNGEHLKKYSDKQIAEMVIPFLKKENINIELNETTIKAIKTERERGKTLKEIAIGSVFYFRPPQQFDEAAVKKWLDASGIEHLKWLKAELSKLDTWSEESIGQIFKKHLDETNEKMLKVAQPVRVALTGTTVSPGIYEVLAILGKKETLERFEVALNMKVSTPSI
jgi:glutamyl-tRNA synthetase